MWFFASQSKDSEKTQRIRPSRRFCMPRPRSIAFVFRLISWCDELGLGDTAQNDHMDLQLRILEDRKGVYTSDFGPKTLFLGKAMRRTQINGRLSSTMCNRRDHEQRKSTVKQAKSKAMIDTSCDGLDLSSSIIQAHYTKVPGHKHPGYRKLSFPI